VHRFPWNGKPTFDLRANGDIFNILPQSVSQKPIQFMTTVETNVFPEKTRADPELDFPFHDPPSRSVRTRTFFLAHSTSGLTWVPAAILEILNLDPVVLEEEFDLPWPGHVCLKIREKCSEARFSLLHLRLAHGGRRVVFLNVLTALTLYPVLFVLYPMRYALCSMLSSIIFPMLYALCPMLYAVLKGGVSLP
jgi:hypothetical protein